MDNFIIGATAMACAIAGLFFLRFWRDAGDRLFAIFALAFWLFGGTRVALALLSRQDDSGILPGSGEHELSIYLVRLAAFVLILIAIIDKNRPMRKAAS